MLNRAKSRFVGEKTNIVQSLASYVKYHGQVVFVSEKIQFFQSDSNLNATEINFDEILRKFYETVLLITSSLFPGEETLI